MLIEELHILFLKSKGISTDTRKIEKDTLFFALVGDNFNGNKYASDALEKGCSFAIVDQKEYVVSNQYILVDDVLRTLQNLANYHRKTMDIPVLAITGSNGKTTCKELIGCVLSTTYTTLMTEGNFNNHLGVPLTILRLTKEHEIAIIEMGASKAGDIMELAEIAEPTHGIITNIGAAHIEGFGSLEGVISTKKELYDYLERARGTIIYHVQDPTLQSIVPLFLNNFTYGTDIGDVTGKLINMNPTIEFSWTYQKYTSPPVKTHLVGKYNFINFLAAITIGKFFNVREDYINQALADYKPTNNRSQIVKTKRNTLLVDCYNANATSMRAALESFVEMQGDNKLVILGDMLELGDISQKEHQKIVDFLRENNLNVLLVGQEFSKLKSEFTSYASYQQLADKEDLEKLDKSTILLKGSRGIKLENLIEKL